VLCFAFRDVRSLEMRFRLDGFDSDGMVIVDELAAVDMERGFGEDRGMSKLDDFVDDFA
jgi:hypothetical protein